MYNLTNEIIQHDTELKAFAIGVYPDREVLIPADSVKILKSKPNINGFYAEAFVYKGKIIIAIRGTELDWKDLSNDLDMSNGELPKQYNNALEFYNDVLKYCREHNINTNQHEIVLVGHSLGGSLVQLLSYATGHLGVTFNAFGAEEIAPKVNILKGLANVRNYGNINDAVFYLNIDKHIGDVYIIETNPQETRPQLTRYHFIEVMGDLKNAIAYNSKIHKKFGDYTSRMLLEESIEESMIDDLDHDYYINIIKKEEEKQKSRSTNNAYYNHYNAPRKLPDLQISLKYNKNDVYDYFKPFLKSITYTDYIDNHCDTLELELFNDDYRFSNDWSLDKGAKLTCNVQYGNQLLKCGTFTIDKNESVFSTKENIVKVTAIAIPSDVPIRRKNTNTFEKMHIRDIAQFFADKYEFKFIANEEDKGIILERVDQVETSDMKFLSDLAYKYGYIFKLTDHTLTFLRLPEQNPIFEINKSNISRIEIFDKTSQKAGYIEYYNPEKGELEYVQIGKSDNNIVQLQQRFHSRGEAQTILATEIKRTSKEKRGVLHLAYPIGNFNAGIDFTLKDFGKNDGVYRITKSIHSITGDFGWQVIGAFEECEEITYKLNKKSKLKI